MTRSSALVALAASVALLAGCAPAPQLPEPITPAKAQEQMDEQNRSWWESMFPDEPMPLVRVVEYRDPGSPDTLVTDCVKAANLEGVTFGADDSWSFPDDAGIIDEVNRAYFVCSLRYPHDLSDPAALGMLSEDELEWNWHYNQKRLVPCLQLLGYHVANSPGEYGGSNGGWWIPYFDMSPIPASDAEWARIDQRCPPSPIGQEMLQYRPTGG